MYSALLAAFVGASHSTGFCLFQSSMISALTHSHQRICVAGSAIGLSVSTVSGSRKNMIQLVAADHLPMTSTTCKNSVTVWRLSSLKCQKTLEWKASVPTLVAFSLSFLQPFCVKKKTFPCDLSLPFSCPLEFFLCPWPWVVFSHCLLHLQLFFPSLTFLTFSLHWTCILRQVLDNLQTSSPRFRLRQSVQPSFSCFLHFPLNVSSCGALSCPLLSFCRPALPPS